MVAPEVDKLIKLLELSSSDNDHESLAAIKKANEVRKKMKKSWREIFTSISSSSSRGNYGGRYGYSPPPPPPEDQGMPSEGRSASEMLELLLGGSKVMSDGTRNFLESLKQGYTKYGSLTAKQMSALRGVFNRYNW